MNKTITSKDRLIAQDIPVLHPDLRGDGNVTLEGQPGLNIRGETQEITAPRTWPVRPADEPGSQPDDQWLSMISNLLHTLQELGDMLDYALAKDNWRDAYLLAAGMNQITEDFLHPDPLFTAKSQKYLRKIGAGLGNRLVVASQRIAQGMLWINGWKPSTRLVDRWQRRLAVFVNELAEVVAGDEELLTRTKEYLLYTGASIIQQIHALPPALKNEIVKLPSCFRSFDQQPEDLRSIAEKFTVDWPERGRQLYVIGIRTSGSYLAPLYGAYLKRCGFQYVNVMTIRPGYPLTIRERATLRNLSNSDGMALLCDDPPISGSTVLKTAALLEGYGLPARRVLLLLQLTGNTSSLPAGLRKYPSIILTGTNWAIHRHFTQDEFRQVLARACPPEVQVLAVERHSAFGDKDSRAHAKALFKVQMVNSNNGELFTRFIQVKGVGLGYFGDHELAIARRLHVYAPNIIAIRNGSIYTEMPEASTNLSPAMPGKDETLEGQLVEYIISRNRLLRVNDDRSLRVRGRNAVWEVASNFLSTNFRAGWFIARLPLVDPYAKKILQPEHPSIVDGDMSLKNWYIDERRGHGLTKLEVAERAFSHMDLACYDPVYDLAALDVEMNGESSSGYLRNTYENRIGEKVSAERWMLLRLVHLWDLKRQMTITSEAAERRMSKIVQAYFSEIFFTEISNRADGAVCALDVDGVLETNPMGFPSLTASSARSLRALLQHGFRVVLATGRSQDEVMDRCAAYHLSGGVAEYGAVIYDSQSGAALPLLNQSEHGALFGLRGRLRNKYGISFDPAYRQSARAYDVDPSGKHAGIDEETISKILAEDKVAGQFHAVRGLAQTDFIPARINKGLGLEEWLAHFDHTAALKIGEGSGQKHIALSVGDGMADLPMFSLAKLAYAPAHARLGAPVENVRVTSRPYQRGLEQAIHALLGHQPGSCQVCKEPDLAPETQYMLELLSVQEDGLHGMLVSALRMFAGKAGR